MITFFFKFQYNISKVTMNKIIVWDIPIILLDLLFV